MSWSTRWRKTAVSLSVLAILGLCLWAQAPAVPELPDRIADYEAFLAAQQQFDSGNPKQSIERLQPVWRFEPVSPLLGRAAILAALSYEKLGEPAEALQVLRHNAERLPQPDGWLLLGRNAEAASDTAGAAAYYQRVYYDYPITQQAIEADAALARLRGILGENFPPAMPQVRLERAARLVRAGQANRAKDEYGAMSADFGGLQREQANVRAVADTYKTLESLRLRHADSDAERLYRMHVTARRAKLETEAAAAVQELGRKHPKSRWRLEALISQGNLHLLTNNAAGYEPFYRAAYQEFPQEPEAAYAHWKVAWAAYMRRAGTDLFEEHLRLFPDSEKASAALYYLKRHSELANRFPLSYYATLVKPKPRKVTEVDFKPSASLAVRLQRAKLLESNRLPEWAEFELQWAARNEANPYPAAFALAQTAFRRGAHDVSLRYIKRYAPGYLARPLQAAPAAFWKLAFPLPYRSSVESNSRARGLDPYIVAALIRQESEFDPKAVSRAKAYGLTQVLPSTGRQISRRAGLTRFTPSMLFQPEINLKLGTYYLKSLLAQHDGSWEQTLAAYNAGKGRVDNWSTWGTFREPAEFIETIPFTETRNYVQVVLRNAYVYRTLYGSTGR